MKCDICKEKEAVIHIQQVNGQNRTDIHFCMDCAHRFGIHTDGPKLEMSFADLAANISSLQKTVKKESLPPTTIAIKNCPVCGCTLASVLKYRQLECPECYEIFKTEVKSLFAESGLNGPYCGSMPQRLAHFKSVLNDRIVLQNKLRKSVEEENYEKAALYRDRIKALNNCRPDDVSGHNGGADFE